MQNKLFRKGLVLATIVLFAGAGIATSTGIVDKSNNIIDNDYVKTSEILENKGSSNCYGFIINIFDNQQSDVQTTICLLLNKLFQENVTIYWICENISVLSKSLGGESQIINRSFEKGIFIVPFTNNDYLNSIATAIVVDYNLSKDVEIYQLNEPIYNIKIHILIEPRVTLYRRPSIDWESYFTCLSEAGFCHQSVLRPMDVLKNLTLDNFNLFIIGGQNGSVNEICDYIHPITFFANWKIKKFVDSGGGFVGSCGGSVKAASGYRRPLVLPISKCYFVNNFIPFQIRIVDRAIYRALPGAGGTYSGGSGVKVKIVNHSCPVSFGLPGIINKTNYWAGPMFLEKLLGSPNSEDLGIIEGFDETGWDWDFYMKYHIIFWEKRSEKFKKSLFKRWIDYSEGKALWITANHGDGKIVLFGDHPEYCAYEWGNTSKRIIYNAILYASSKGPFFADINYVWPLS